MSTVSRRHLPVLLWLVGTLASARAETVDPLGANIDAAVDPGDDLFQHANGGWLRRHPIPPDESEYGLASLVRDDLYTTLRRIHEQAAAAPARPGSDEQKIADFWSTGLDEQKARRLGLGPLRPLLRRIDAVRSLPQAFDAALDLQGAGVGAFFILYVDADQRDNRSAALYAWQGGLGLPDRSFYVDDEASVRQARRGYARYLSRMLVLLGRDAASAPADARAVLRLETAMARASRALEDTRDPLKNYNRVAPADFTARYTQSLDWPRRLDAWGVRPAFIAVGQPEYFAALQTILHSTPLPVLRDYLRLQLVTKYAEALGPAFDQVYFDFYERTLSGRQRQRPRWKRLIDTESGSGAVPDSIGMIVGRRYVQERFPQRAKTRYAEMARSIIEAYGDRIRQLSWMSEGTRAKALEKLAAVTVKVGYPERWNDHATLAIGRRSHADNLIAIERWAFDQAIARIDQPVDRTKWYMVPQTYNAYYNPPYNEIVLPAAAFAIPGLADEQIDEAVAYGYAGASTIGHEITHGFDDGGRHYDAAGNLSEWWTAEDAQAFEQRASGLVRQFNAYEPLPGLHINGAASLGENIADLGGLTIALEAYKRTDHYRRGDIVSGRSPLQRFFLGYSLAWLEHSRDERLKRLLLSDVHAPAKYRVLGPVSNIPEFYEAFGVTPQRKMWRDPADRVSIW